MKVAMPICRNILYARLRRRRFVQPVMYGLILFGWFAGSPIFTCAAGKDYRAWMNSFSQIPPYQRMIGKDYDQDGACNLMEYAFGGDPVVRGTGALFWFVSGNSVPRLQFRVHVDTQFPDLLPAFKSSLTDPSWQSLSSPVYENAGISDGCLLMNAILPEAKSGFLRIAVTVPADTMKIIDVRDYGVNMNDAQDDTTAFQAALDQGGIIMVPPGIALLSNALHVASGTWLIGAGFASSELRWSSQASSGGLTGGSMALSGLWLRSMTTVDSAALHCTQGPFHASGIAIGGNWQEGILIENCTNSFVSGIKFNGDTTTVSAIHYSGNSTDGILEDVHAQNSPNGTGIFISGTPANLTMRRVTAIANAYSIYIDPTGLASNICIYDFDTQSTKSCLWLNKTVNSTFYSGYCGFNDWSNTLYEAAVTVNNSTNLVFSGIRMQNNSPILDTARGVLVKQCNGVDFTAMDIRGMKWGFIAETNAAAVTVDGVNFYDDVSSAYTLRSGSSVTVIPYQKLR